EGCHIQDLAEADQLRLCGSSGAAAQPSALSRWKVGTDGSARGLSDAMGPRRQGICAGGDRVEIAMAGGEVLASLAPQCPRVCDVDIRVSVHDVSGRAQPSALEAPDIWRRQSAERQDRRRLERLF